MRVDTSCKDDRSHGDLHAEHSTSFPLPDTQYTIPEKFFRFCFLVFSEKHYKHQRNSTSCHDIIIYVESSLTTLQENTKGATQHNICLLPCHKICHLTTPILSVTSISPSLRPLCPMSTYCSVTKHFYNGRAASDGYPATSSERATAGNVG